MDMPHLEDGNAGEVAASRRGPALMVVLCAGVALTLLLFRWELARERTMARADMERWASSHATALQGRVERDLAAVESIAGLFAVWDRVERHEFRWLVQAALASNTDIQALEWVPRVSHAARDVYEARARAEGLAQFRFMEGAEPGGTAPAAARAEYFPVYLVEPLAANEPLVGLDVATNPAVAAAMAAACDTGRTMITEPYRLAPESDNQFGFLILQPVYRKGRSPEAVEERREGLLGCVAGVVRTSSLVESAWRGLPSAGLNATLYDEGPSGAQPLYVRGSGAPIQASGDDPEWFYRVALQVPGRKWSVAFSPAPGFRAAHPETSAYLVLLGGLLGTGLLGMFLHSRTRHAMQVARLAAELASANRRLEESDARVAPAHRAWGTDIGSIRAPLFMHDEAGRYSYSPPNLEDSTERERVRQASRLRVELEQLVSGVSTKFIGLLAAQLDAAINEALGAMGRLAAADRSYVFRFSPGGKTMRNTHMWCAAGVAPHGHTLQGLSVVRFAWAMARFRCSQPIHVQRIGDLPPEAAPEKLLIQARSVRSLVLVPLMQGGKPVGFLGLDSMTEEKAWPEEIIPLLKTIGEVFVNAWARARTEESLRASDARFHHLADAAPQIFWTADADGRVGYFSRQWYAFTGVPEGQPGPGGWVSAAHHDDARSSGEAWRRAVQTGRPFEHQFRLRDGRSGEYRWHLARAVPIRDEDGRVAEWFGTLTDIHAQKQAEAVLKEADQRKDLFLAMLAHELRNPLAPIRNAVHVLKLGPDAADGTVRWAADLVDRQIAHLARLVDDLLDVARVTTGKIQLRREPLDLRTAVRRAVEAVGPSAAEHGHDLTVELPDAPLWIEGDAARLIQVIDNLLSNAAKYTEDGGRIELTAERAGTEAVVSVRDTGVGIAAELLPDIFEPFRQAERSLDRSQGGLGLGLALVRHLAELHGGHVEARSPGPGRGSEFRLHLPLSSGPVPCERRLAAEAAASCSARRVLVVDDNVDVANSFLMLLEAMGHEVRLAYAGADALEAAAAFRPQVILLDIGLPGMNGYEVARRLRAQHRAERVCMVAVTGYGQEEDRNRGRDAGFDHHLVKPVTPEALERILHSV